MDLKKIIREEMDDWDWVRNISANPFLTDSPLTVLWLDRKISKAEAGLIINLLSEAGFRSKSPEMAVNSIYNYSSHKSCYIKGYYNALNEGKISYGFDLITFDENKWRYVRSDLEGKPYKEYKVTNILGSIMKESEEDDFDWIREIPGSNRLPEDENDKSITIGNMAFEVVKSVGHYKEYRVYEDRFSGCIIWEHAYTEEIFYATPDWYESGHIPIEDDNGRIGDVLVPDFTYDSEVKDWYSKNYFEEVYRLIRRDGH